MPPGLEFARACRGTAALAAALVISGCGTKPERAEVFGFVTDCPDGNWEECRRQHNSADRATVEGFRNLLTKSFDQTYQHSSLRSTTKREDFELVVVRDPHRAFLFQSSIDSVGGKKVRVIQTSAETFATISKIAIARHFYGLSPNFKEEWLAQYLLYIRKTPDGDPIVDPLRASGLISMSEGKAVQGVPDFTSAIREGINDTYTVITFMVAHELYHLEYPFTCRESEAQCEGLRRADEGKADRSAIELLRLIAAEDDPPDHVLQVPVYIFSQFMVAMEGSKGRTPILPGSHPPDHERLRSAATALSDWVKEHPDSKSSAFLQEFANVVLRIVGRIDSETPARYFADLDQEAVPVTLQSLKVY